MPKPTTKQRVLALLAGIVLLTFTVWFSAMVSPVIGFFFLVGSIWFIVQGFRVNTPALRTVSIVILSIAATVSLLAAAYFAWIGGYTF